MREREREKEQTPLGYVVARLNDCQGLLVDTKLESFGKSCLVMELKT